MEKDRRRIVLINREFQARQILRFVALNIAIMVVFAGFLYLFLNSEIQANLFAAHVTFKNVQEMLFPIVLTLTLLNVMASSLVIAVMVLYTSHKIAGPLYRFKAVIDELAGRNLTPFASIREDDQLHELSASTKKLAGTLRQDYLEAGAVLAELRSMIASGRPNAEMEVKVQQLQGIMQMYRS